MQKKRRRRRLKKNVKRAFIGIGAFLIGVIILVIGVSVAKNINENKPEPVNPDIGKETIHKIELMDVYPKDLIALYEKNKEARDFVLSYFIEKDKEHKIDLGEYEFSDEMPHFLQWDVRWGFTDYGGETVAYAGCGPVALSMVGYHLTRDAKTFSPDKVVKFALDEDYCVPDAGTAWALMDEGAESLGLQVETLPLVEDIMIDRLEQGKPIILIMGPGVFTGSGHFIVLRDYEDGYFYINDPNSIIRTEKKWKFSEFSDQILNIWAYSV